MAATKAATAKFSSILRREVYPEVGDKVTTDSDLSATGRRLIGREFSGVYASDRIPKFKASGTTYYIVNIDRHDQPGTHWLALVRRGRDVYLYDSFGRPVQQTLPHLPDLCVSQGMKLDAGKSRPEQRVDQDDCGARSMAWLLLFKRFGPRVAKLISE
jgi:hypothetical protein